MTWSRRQVVSAVSVLSVAAVTTACVTVDVTGSRSDAGATHGSCDRFDSLSGQLRVGDPASARPTVVPGDRPLELGESVPPVIHRCWSRSNSARTTLLSSRSAGMGPSAGLPGSCRSPDYGPPMPPSRSQVRAFCRST